MGTFLSAKAGYIDSSRRGVWTLTELGHAAELSHDEALTLFREVHAKFQEARRLRRQAEADEETTSPPEDETESDRGYRELVLETLQGLEPEGFERFCQRLLRESGFQDVTVTGRTGDGGIDGIGILRGRRYEITQVGQTLRLQGKLERRKANMAHDRATG